MAWLSTFAGPTSLHLSIDFVLFFLKVGKKLPLKVNKVRHSPLPFRIFAAQMKAAIRVYFVYGHRLSAKKNKEKTCVSINFYFFSVDNSCDTKDTLCPCQKIRRKLRVGGYGCEVEGGCGCGWVTHRSGVCVSVCIQGGQLQCRGWVLKKIWIWSEMTTLPGCSRSEVYKLESDLQRTAQNRQICRWVGVAARQWV